MTESVQGNAINKGFERVTGEIFGCEKSETAQENRNWMQMSAASLDKIWDNSEDDIYNELL